MVQLEQMSRKELQALAKEHGIKANLSNAAIIEALQEKMACAQEDAAVEEIETAQPEVEAVPQAAVEPPSSLAAAETEAQPETERSFEVGDQVEVLVEGAWVSATIKRVNKTSFRTALEDGQQMTLKMSEIRFPMPKEDLQADQPEMEEEVAEGQEEEEEEVEEDPTAAETVEAEMDCEGDAEEAPVEADLVAAEMEEDEQQEEELEEEVAATSADVQPLDDDAMIAIINAMVNENDVLSSLPPRRKSISRESLNRLSMPKASRLSIPKAEPSEPSATSTSAEPEARRKTFATSPVKPHSSIKPKTNAAQRLRLESLQKKRMEESKFLQKNQRSSMIASLPSRKTSLLQTPLSSTKPTTATATSTGVGKTPSNVATTASGQRKTPDFARLHKQQFSSQKPITAIVERKSSIVHKMEDAFHKAYDRATTTPSENVANLAQGVAKKIRPLTVEKRIPSPGVTVGTIRTPSSSTLGHRPTPKESTAQRLQSTRDVQRSKAAIDQKAKREATFNMRRLSDADIECY